MMHVTQADYVTWQVNYLRLHTPFWSLFSQTLLKLRKEIETHQARLTDNTSERPKPLAAGQGQSNRQWAIGTGNWAMCTGQWAMSRQGLGTGIMTGVTTEAAYK